eukprot:TRINITY_DN35921_c0_g1_i1.p1 TRINITY_DN35921_c0_g1~~TRINITY_DN35921_c0_g1_i1.p1  ORF type:complete len:241 (-),score=78.21 TRINITY_DN35921_c0_g1_i1:12-734(-)
MTNLELEALQQEADSIQEWLASGNPRQAISRAALHLPEQTPDLAGGGEVERRCHRLEAQISDLQEELRREQLVARLANCKTRQWTAAEAGAQEDISQLLAKAKGFTQTAEMPHKAGEELLALLASLGQLRSRYIDMKSRCETLERELGREHQLESLFAERRRFWETFLSKHTLQLERGEEDLARLREEVQEAQHRRDAVRREEARLEMAARQDESTLQQLRQQLRQLHVQNAKLEVDVAN